MPITYKDAGVDIDAGDLFVRKKSPMSNPPSGRKC